MNAPICKHASSGCNYPEGECLGLCQESKTAPANKTQILQALGAFVRQRPGLEFGNYGNVSAYRSELRRITRQLHDAESLIAAAAMRDSLNADDILQATKRAFSGRLDIVVDGDSVRIDYCTGQYFPTEYRASVCAVISQALWDYWRDSCGGGACGQEIRKHARQNLGRGIASRWFQ